MIPANAFTKLVSDIGGAIDRRCKAQNVSDVEVISAVVTVLAASIQMLETPADRETFLEEAIRQLRLAVHEQARSN